jgi:hypothetical protein
VIWRIVDHAGSIASILGALIGVYILVRELRMADEVHILKGEEEKWHDPTSRS